MALFEVKDSDRQIYEEQIRDFLPARVIDIHTHVWLEQFRSGTGAGGGRVQTWPARVAKDNAIEDLVETNRLLLPGKQVTSLLFGNVMEPGDDLEAGNAYVQTCARQAGFPALIFSRPQWSAAVLEDKIRAGGFCGAKVYLSLAEPYLPADEIRIFDYLPPHQLDVLNRHGWIVMLHIPRPGRLRDPVNLAQMLEIEQRWPDAKVIVAHVGRAYCPEDLGCAFDVLKPTKRLLFDFSANTNAEVFQRLLEAVGPSRILFGSDLPITRMRMRRICEAGNYVNLVPAGWYGDVSGDPHLREVHGDEAARLTFFLYEEILAFRWAAVACGLSRPEIESVFYTNAARLLTMAKG